MDAGYVGANFIVTDILRNCSFNVSYNDSTIATSNFELGVSVPDALFFGDHKLNNYNCDTNSFVVRVCRCLGAKVLSSNLNIIYNHENAAQLLGGFSGDLDNDSDTNTAINIGHQA